MQTAIPIFEGFTALDAIGPYEVLQRLPDAEVVFCAPEAGEYRTDNGMLGVLADRSFDQVPAPDIVLVPGGFGSRKLIEHPNAYTEWLLAVDTGTKYTTSVCTGSLVLAAAGLLEGIEATTHWAAREILAALGAVPVAERVVQRGKIVTAAGVSSGIDMALRLVEEMEGEQAAQAAQLGIEYDPDPPHRTGSLESSPPELVDAVREQLAAEGARIAERLAAG